MKKLIITLVLAAMPVITFAQVTAFDKFEGKDDIATLEINKKMFDILKSMEIDVKDATAKEYLKKAEKLNNLKVYMTSNTGLGAEMKSTVESYLKNNPLERLMSMKDDGRTIKIYAREDNTSQDLKEMLVFIEGAGDDKETVLLSLTASL